MIWPGKNRGERTKTEKSKFRLNISLAIAVNTCILRGITNNNNATQGDDTMSEFTETIKGLTLNELYKVYAGNLDVMQGISKIAHSYDRTYLLNRLILINNEIQEREVSRADKLNKKQEGGNDN